MSMKKIYLDNNIIIDVKNSRDESIKRTVNSLDRNEYQIVYSPAHVEEIAVTTMRDGKSAAMATDKLAFLAELTTSIELLPFRLRGLKLMERDGIFVYKEHPKRCYKRVIEGYDSNAVAEALQKQKLANAEAFGESNNVTSMEANNIDIQKEIDLAKPRIHQILINHFNVLKADGRFGEYIPDACPSCGDLNFQYARNYFPIHEMLMEKIFDFLEIRRYFPDKLEQFINGLHDATHAIYAAYCDILVTNDRNFRQKTKAAYRWLGVETIVLSRKEFVDYIAGQSDSPSRPCGAS
jgi:predicted nucleic acid-binding protein